VSWKATIDPTETADLFTVTFECEINAPDLKQPVHTTEMFRVLRPTWSKVDERDKLRAAARTRILQLQTKQS
jgi:general secretion pathway protein I